MPPHSRAQARLMRAAAHGDVELPGMSRAEADEYVSGYSTKNLPERASKAKGRNAQRDRQAAKRKKAAKKTGAKRNFRGGYGMA